MDILKIIAVILIVLSLFITDVVFSKMYQRKVAKNGLHVFCKTFLHKIAKTFCRSLQLHFVGNCKPGWQSWYLPAI